MIWISLKVKWYLFLEERKVRSFFYRNLQFYRHDRLCKQMYQSLNPYRISKKFLQKKGEQEVHTYGETPLTSLYAIAKQCNLLSTDHVFDLGCGRGRGVFFLADLFGCQVTGVEWVPEFMSYAQQMCNDQKGSIHWICQDIRGIDLSKATWIYLCGTSFSDVLILELITKFSALDSSVQIITVSYPLTDYSDFFEIKQQFAVSFPWGVAAVYAQTLKLQ